MREEYFINIAIDKAIKTYIATKNQPNNVNYNSFLVVVIRILVLIYGEADILNPYYLNNDIAFLNNLAKYGLSKSDVVIFKDELFNFYQFALENNKKNIKERNPYFRSVLKILVDMFIMKRKSIGIKYDEEETFLDLAYTSHTTDYYRISDNYCMNDDPRFIEKYYYSKINELDVTKDLSKTINMNLNLDALKQIGVNLSNITNMSEQELITAKEEAYSYFEIDSTKPNRDELLQNSVDYLNMYGRRKVTSGNGFVDILLLMSVIVTFFEGFMEVIEINNVKYEIVKNYKEALNKEELTEKLTDYFDDFDYIVGDIAYNKLRLKGFNDQDNKNFKPLNDVAKVEEYITNSCAYGCKWFMLKKIKD